MTDRDRALVEALALWRELRAPELADVIDRLTVATPIAGKTVAARSAAWLAMAARRDPMELGSLLATPWPGTWKKALPLLEALLEWPDDPRLAIGLARRAGDPRYRTLTAGRFHRPLFARLEALRDVRAVPVLRVQLARTDLSHSYLRMLAEHAIDALAAVAPEPVDVARFAPLAPAVEQTEVALVAAILAEPDNRELRAVYGDWLSDRGDPRGELIALQLAGRDGSKLIREHGAAWAGPIGTWFEPEGRCFEGGMFSGGTLCRGAPDLDRMLLDPAWALIRTLRWGHSAAPVPELLDRVPSVRVLGGVDAKPARAIAEGPPRALTEFGFYGAADAELGGALATFPALPALRRLGVTMSAAGTVRWFRDAAVVERIERLAIRDTNAAAALPELAARPGALRVIDLVEHGAETLEHPTGWHVELRREVAPGPFTKIHAERRAGGMRRRFASDVARVLAAIPADWPTELVVEVDRLPTLSRPEHEELVAAVARFPRLTRVSVPWVALPPRVEPASLQLALRMRGVGPSQLRALWPLLVDELGQRYDVLQVNSNQTLRKLGPQPLERAIAWAEKPGTSSIRLARDAAGDRLRLAWSAHELFLHADLEIRAPIDLVAWFVRLVTTVGGHSARLGFGTWDQHAAAFSLAPFRDVPEPGWLMAFGGTYATLLPIDEVAAIAGVTAIAAPAHVVVALAPAPEVASAAQLRDVSRGLRGILVRQVVRRLGYELQARARELLGGAAAAIGMAPAFDPEAPFVARFAGPKQGELVVELDNLLATPSVRISLTKPGVGGTHTHLLMPDYHTRVATLAELDAVLAAAAPRAMADAPAWFA